jgi:hypothetical protein
MKSGPGKYIFMVGELAFYFLVEQQIVILYGVVLCESGMRRKNDTFKSVGCFF